jgi:hypothetical protein
VCHGAHRGSVTTADQRHQVSRRVHLGGVDKRLDYLTAQVAYGVFLAAGSVGAQQLL